MSKNKLINNEYIKSNQGLVLVVGTRYGEDHNKFKKIENALNKNNFLNIMIIDFDEGFNQTNLTKTLENFMLKYEETTIILAIHGAQIFPGGDHYSLIGKDVSESPLNFLGGAIANFLHGNIVRSSIVLESIGNAAKSSFAKKLNVWQYSCQGSKLIDAAQKYLPKGTKYVSESKGFIKSGIFLNSFLQELNANREFSFDEFYKDYLAMSVKINRYENTMQPVKFIIGEKPETSVEKADKLVKEISSNTINKDKYKNAIEYHCQKLASAKPELLNYENSYWSICEEITPDNVNIPSFMYSLSDSQSYTLCINKSGQQSYLVYKMIKFLGYRSYFSGIKSYDDNSCAKNIVTIAEGSSIAEHYYNI